MDEKAIRAHLVKTGWELSKTGSYVSSMKLASHWGADERTVRVRFNKLSITIEILMRASARWLRIGGCSFDAVRQCPDGRLQVISFYLPAEKRA